MLINSRSSVAVGKNIATEEAAGRPRKQAIAIALNVKRKAGGKVAPKPKATLAQVKSERRAE
jgi:hypothetical protein